MSANDSSSMEIAPNATVDYWNNLNLPEDGADHVDWATAASIIDARIGERFLKPASQLISIQEEDEFGTFGFAILALDCLAIEAIQGFKKGYLQHNYKSKELFDDFIANWPDLHGKLGQFPGLDLYSQLRCCLHHTGSTDRIKVRRSGDLIFKESGYWHINRNEFHDGVLAQFNAYLEIIKSGGNSELRKNLKKKMDHICAS